MAAGRTESLLVDEDTGVLRRDRVLVQNTPQAVLVMGFGPRADLLRRFACGEDDEEDDPFIARCRDVAGAAESGKFAKARQSGIPRSVLKIQDSMFRRLAIAEAFAKAGFNPDEPRDERGRWTGEGGDEDDRPLIEGRSVATAVAGASAADDFASSLASRGLWALGGQLSRQALTGLALLDERFSAPTAFLGTIFIPSNSDLQRRGTIPDRPDITFDYDEDTGVLKLSRDGAVFFAGQNQRGIFRDEQGHAFGRYVGGNIVLDPDALPIAAAQAHQDSGSRSDAPPLLETDADRNEPKLCPKPTEENTNGRSAQAKAYQEQITQMPPGLDIKLPDPKTGKLVSFDGCCTPANPYCPSTGDYLMEAKGEKFQKHMLDLEKWEIWFTGREKTEGQMDRQNRTAGAAGWKVLWFFAEPGPAAYFGKHARDNELANIQVFFAPPVAP